MEKRIVICFGESATGSLSEGYLINSLPQLFDLLGSPPPNSLGIFQAIRLLIIRHPLLFFRVRKENCSTPDYLRALSIVDQCTFKERFLGFSLPEVDNRHILDPFLAFCRRESLFFMHKCDPFPHYIAP